MLIRSVKLADALFASVCKEVTQKSQDISGSVAATLLQTEDTKEALLKCGREAKDARTNITTKIEREFMFDATIV